MKLFHCILFCQIAAAAVLVPPLTAQTQPVVTAASRVFNSNQRCAELGDMIRVTTSPTVPESLRSKYFLYINGVPFKGVKPNLSSASNGLLFEIAKSPADSVAWRAVYDWPYMAPADARITLGSENSDTLASTVRNFDMELVKTWPFAWIPLLLIAVLLATVLLLGANTGMLRDGMKLNMMFSLSRTQLAFWTFIILSSYLLIWLLTGDAPAISGSVTTLLAISAAGTGGAVIVDRVNQVPPMSIAERKSKNPFQGFFTDILTETEGISIHRLQIFLFTLIVGGVFVRDVILHLTMPQFDANTLWLMGISTAGYVGLKQTEQSATKSTATLDPAKADG